MTFFRKSFLFLILLLMSILGFSQTDKLTIEATNPLSFGRMNQTIALSVQQLQSLDEVSMNNIYVKTAAGKKLLCQAINSDGDHRADKVIFQANFGLNQTRLFYVYEGGRHFYKPDQYKAYGRFVRERYGDFAWENNRIAQRTYDQALKPFTCK